MGEYSCTTRSITVDQRNTVPQVRNVESNADKSIKDPQGNSLPPCIVMERANAGMGEFASPGVQDSEGCYMWTL